MKLILLAAAAALAVPAVAQTTTDTQTDTSATATTGQTDMSASASTGATTAEQLGGYAPSTPPMPAAAPPGATVVFVPSVSPDQAFPPPPPMASYPWCKPGQFDNCKERENARGQGLHNQHR